MTTNDIIDFKQLLEAEYPHVLSWKMRMITKHFLFHHKEARLLAVCYPEQYPDHHKLWREIEGL